MPTLPAPLNHLSVIPVLGVPLAKTDYAGALDALNILADQPAPAAVSACNTHLVALSRHDPSFRQVLRTFDLILPDSTVLKWTMNAMGAGLDDRVYGPYLMRHVLLHAPAHRRHFFFGGTQECLADLEKSARQLRPDLQIAGSLSPPFGQWSEADEEKFAREIQAARPDFIWVALGGERQERWIARNLHRHPRGVFLAVGDAFRLLAGHGKFAPAWMQRAGLNWLHRLCEEPLRLWQRYFRFNSLYLLQLLAWTAEDRRLSQPAPKSRLRIAFYGARGIPARYAGFETVIQELGQRLAASGHEVMVYNRSGHYREKPSSFLGMALVYLPNLRLRSLDTISHSLLCTLHCAFQPVDVVYLCGVGNACFAPFLRWSGKKVIINVDGIDFKRRKWSGFARWWLYRSEKWSIRFTNQVIADNEEVVRHYQELHNFTPLHLSYGVSPPPPPGTHRLLINGGSSPANTGSTSADSHRKTNPTSCCKPTPFPPKLFLWSWSAWRATKSPSSVTFNNSPTPRSSSPAPFMAPDTPSSARTAVPLSSPPPSKLPDSCCSTKWASATRSFSASLPPLVKLSATAASLFPARTPPPHWPNSSIMPLPPIQLFSPSEKNPAPGLSLSTAGILFFSSMRPFSPAWFPPPFRRVLPPPLTPR